MYKDIAGNPLDAGDQVLLPTSFGSAIVGTIQKVDSILGSDPKSAPLVHLQFNFSLPALPNGLVGGILKIVSPSS
jgi:hypothetical protein